MQAKKVGSGANYILGKSFYETEDYGQAYTYLQAAGKDDPITPIFLTVSGGLY